MCVKYAKNHLTSNCKKVQNEPVICANCRGNHLANATIHTEYKSRLKQVEKRKIMNQQNRTLTRTKTFNLDTRYEQQFPQLSAPRTFETSI